MVCVLAPPPPLQEIMDLLLSRFYTRVKVDIFQEVVLIFIQIPNIMLRNHK